MFLVALENSIHAGLRHLMGKHTYQPNHRETAYHGNGTTVNGVDGVTSQHIYYSKSNTPHEASPHAHGGDAT